MTVGVVVPAYRETDGLATLLASIARLDEKPRVVVAVDGAWPATVEVARAHGVDVLELQENRGSYSARNAGIEHLLRDGEPELVLFTDADCAVTTHWVAGHREALREAELSAGGVRFTFRRSRPTPAEWVDAVRHLQQQKYVESDGYGATCNLAVRGEVLRQHRFDGTLRTGGDAEFCRRVVASGARLVYAPEALVEHPARDLRELKVKADRVVSGVARHRERWTGRPRPRLLPTRSAWRRAQREGVARGLVWGMGVTALDWYFDLRLRRALGRLGRP